MQFEKDRTLVAGDSIIQDPNHTSPIPEVDPVSPG